MKAKAIFRFEDKEASFSLDETMWNLTTLHKLVRASHKNPYDWLRRPDVQELVKVLQRSLNAESIIETREGCKGGTWGPWQLSIAYAAFLGCQSDFWLDDIIEPEITQYAEKHLRLAELKQLRKQHAF